MTTIAGKGPDFAGGAQYADDHMTCFLQGSTQYDALGHVWYDGQIWNGLRLQDHHRWSGQGQRHAIAEKGVVGRGILLDIARFRGKEVLDVAETFTHEDLMACAKAQGTEIRRTTSSSSAPAGSPSSTRSAARSSTELRRAGPHVQPRTRDWFHDMEIPNLVTDTIANEVTVDPVTGVVLPLHNALMRNLGRHPHRDRRGSMTSPPTARTTASTRSCTRRPAQGRSTAPARPSTPSSSSSPVMASTYDQRQWLAVLDDAGMPSDITPSFTDALSMFRDAVGRHADRPLIHYFDCTLTVGEVDRMTDALGAGLVSLGGEARRPRRRVPPERAPVRARDARHAGRPAASWCRSTR